MSMENLKRDTSNHSLTLQKHKKSSNSELTMKNDYLLMQHLDRKKEKFEKNLTKLQDGIKYNETQLLENSRKCLEDQKKFDDELKKLKSKNEILKKDIETISTEHLKSLENEMQLIQMENLNLHYQNKEQENKIWRYELELRYAVKIVAQLNQIVTDYNKKASKNVCQMTQTNSNEELKTMPEVSKVDCTQ